MNVFVTGAAGWTARYILAALRKAGHSVIGFDLPSKRYDASSQAWLGDSVQGDVADFPSVRQAMASSDVVIHLAVAIGEKSYRSPQLPFSTNVTGTYNVFEAARQIGLSRIVLMSEAAVHLDMDNRRTGWDAYEWRSGAGSDHLYDLTKRLQEQIARDFCDTFGMTTVVLRAGHIVDGRAGVDPHGRPLAEVQYCRGGWVCAHDLASVCVNALHADVTGFNVFNVVGSMSAFKEFDVARTEDQLGVKLSTRFEAFS